MWVDPWGWEKCRLSKEDLEKLGSAPDRMKNPHRHHKVRENAPSNWSKKNRDYILQAQDILKYYCIDLNTDLRNFTWARNGGGAHTIKAAQHVHEKIITAAPQGKDAVEEALNDLGKEMIKGKFYERK